MWTCADYASPCVRTRSAIWMLKNAGTHRCIRIKAIACADGISCVQAKGAAVQSRASAEAASDGRMSFVHTLDHAGLRR